MLMLGAIRDDINRVHLKFILKLTKNIEENDKR